MKIFFIFPILLFVGCANVASTKFSFSDTNGASVTVEMPKEVDAKDLRVEIDAKNGIAKIIASSWISRNVETINAQSKREENVNELVEKASEGVTRGAIKGIIP